MSVVDGVVAAALIVACVTDLTRGRIPNALTLPLWPLGIVWWLVAGPWWFGLLGLAVAFPVHFLLWSLGVNKGGDAKLMIAIGALYGYAEMLEATAWELILFGPFSLIWVAVRGDWSTWWQAQKVALGRVLGPYAKALPIAQLQNLDAVEEPELNYIPKAPFLALAVLIGRVTDWLQVFQW